MFPEEELAFQFGGSGASVEFVALSWALLTDFE